MEVFRTADVPCASRTASWNEVYTSRFAPVAVAPTDQRRFQAELEIGALGEVEFATVRSRPTSVERRRDQARRADTRLFGFVMLLSGSGWASHCGHEGPLEAGDVILSDNTEPMRCCYDVPIEGLTVRVPEAMLKARLPSYEQLRGRRLPGRVGLSETAVAMARCLRSQLDGALPPTCATKAASQLLDMLAMSYALAFETPVEAHSVSAMRRARVLAFVESRLADPDLSPAAVAAALVISPRYLRKLMAEQGETASSFILRRRLEECAKALASDIHRARSITDVAFAWGFNSTAHFARVFKSRFGLSPRDYREASRIAASPR